MIIAELKDNNGAAFDNSKKCFDLTKGRFKVKLLLTCHQFKVNRVQIGLFKKQHLGCICYLDEWFVTYGKSIHVLSIHVVVLKTYFTANVE